MHSEPPLSRSCTNTNAEQSADHQLISLGIIFEGTQTNRHCAKVSGIPDVTFAVAPKPAGLGFLVMDDSGLL
jgi:hypothetical protein